MCLGLISYIIKGRNPKFGVWMQLGAAKCRIPLWGHCKLDLDLLPQFLNNFVSSLSPILFHEEISNFVCGRTLVLLIVAYYFGVTMTLL